ncbi:hypothetical protein D3C81_1793020 [compost metagenome]
MRAGQRRPHHLGSALAYHPLYLAQQGLLDIGAVHPPAQQADQQQEQRRQAQDAVERHRSAHAQPIGSQPQLKRIDQRLQGAQDYTRAAQEGIKQRRHGSS